MNRIFWTGVLAMLLLGAGCDTKDKRPNIVLVVVDDLGAHVGQMGGDGGRAQEGAVDHPDASQRCMACFR